MKRTLILVLAITFLLSFSGNVFAGWVTGCTVEQVKKTPTGAYARVDNSGVKIFALIAPTLENQMLAIFLTAIASGQTVDVLYDAPSAKFIGVAANQ